MIRFRANSITVWLWFFAALAILFLGIYFFQNSRQGASNDVEPSATSSPSPSVSVSTFVRQYEEVGECGGKTYMSLDEALADPDSACVLALKDVAVLPALVVQLRYLGELVIRSDTITTLPSAIGQLSQLEVLDVAGSENLAFLPEAVGSLQQLRLLNIAGTAIGEVPETMGQLQGLERFFVHRGQFSDERLDSLRELLPNTTIVQLNPRLISSQ